MKYTFYKDKDSGVEMASIEVDPTNTVVRPATKQDHEDAKAHEAAEKAREAALKSAEKAAAAQQDVLSDADKKVVQDEEDAEAAYQKKKR